jgi:pyruvate formate lyase activating enzyme
MATLEAELAAHAAESPLAEALPGNHVRCLACGLRCRIFPGCAGVCKVRFNRDGKLYAPRGYVAGLQLDPIEKKPFFHVLPGRTALSFGMLGCNLHCPYCQNWVTSQTLRDLRAGTRVQEITAARMVEEALRQRAALVVSTYNEPLISAEWALEIFTLARQRGLRTAFVSNGNATPDVLEYLRPQLDCFKVDLKSFRDASYRRLGGRLRSVLDSLERIHRLGFWLEVVTLIVPGFNDTDEELGDIAAFLAGLSPDIPWHVTAFHPQYKLTEPPPTSAATLRRAAEVGLRAGLRFVYAGNLPGATGQFEDTRCPRCQLSLIRRHGCRTVANRLRDGSCPQCLEPIPGVWSL